MRQLKYLKCYKEIINTEISITAPTPTKNNFIIFVNYKTEYVCGSLHVYSMQQFI